MSCTPHHPVMLHSFWWSSIAVVSCSPASRLSASKFCWRSRICRRMPGHSTWFRRSLALPALCSSPPRRRCPEWIDRTSMSLHGRFTLTSFRPRSAVCYLSPKFPSWKVNPLCSRGLPRSFTQRGTHCSTGCFSTYWKSMTSRHRRTQMMPPAQTPVIPVVTESPSPHTPLCNPGHTSVV
jgi:hypothetical protein